jgi:transcriptional regulator with XRE-family HTH domain
MCPISVQRYESGTHKLNVEKIQLVADALSVPIIYFFKSGYEERVAEVAPAYVNTEERTLLRHFRKIEEKSAKLLVIHVARLAAKRGIGDGSRKTQ